MSIRTDLDAGQPVTTTAAGWSLARMAVAAGMMALPGAANADLATTLSGLAPGQDYRVIFQSAGTFYATSSDIADYNVRQHGGRAVVDPARVLLGFVGEYRYGLRPFQRRLFSRMHGRTYLRHTGQSGCKFDCGPVRGPWRRVLG